MWCAAARSSFNLGLISLPKSLTPALVRLLLAALVMLAPAGCAATASRLPVLAALATATPTASATLTPSATPSATVTLTPSATPTAAPTATPVPTLAPTGPSSPIQHVVLISIDGLRPDAWDQADTPVLDGLRVMGAYSPAAQAVLPSVTLVNHASMLGGMGPAKHGITWNDSEPERGKINGPTVFSVAHAAGLTTAMVVGKPKLDHLVLPGSVDTYIYAGYTDAQVVDKALPVVAAGLPDLLFIHLPDVDSAGHASGWMAPEQLATISRTDTQIGRVVTALEAGGYLPTTLLIITADHGGQGLRHGGDLPVEMTIPWLAIGPGVPAEVILPEPIVIYDTAATILQVFGLPIPESWDGRPVMGIFQPLPD